MHASRLASGINTDADVQGIPFQQPGFCEASFNATAPPIECPNKNMGTSLCLEAIVCM